MQPARRSVPILTLVAISWIGTYAAAGTNVSGDITVSTNWTVAGSPYTLTATVTVRNGATLTIDPGVTVFGDPGTSLRIGTDSPPESGQLVSIGSASEPITFDATIQAPGGWEGLYFGDGSDLDGAESVMEYCVVTNGGQNLGSGARNVQLVNTNQPTMNKVAMTASAGWGWKCDNSVPNLSYCSVTDNVLGGGSSINATMVAVEHWWGDPGGPHDPSPGPPDQNNNPAGQPVTDLIEYRPWLHAPPCLSTRPITATQGANGSIAPPGITSSYCDTAQEYTITPDPGFLIQDVVVDGSSQGPIANYTFQPQDELSEHTITAIFVSATASAESMSPAFALRAVTPNPAHRSARITYELPRSVAVRLSLHDVQGREVSVLASGFTPAGRYAVQLDADAAGLRSGIYFVRYQVPGQRFVQRVIVLD